MTGCSAYSLISEAVVNEIKIRLADPSLTLQQIVRDMNFSDQSMFTNFFKRHTGITPLRYRNSI